jgi:hypothetical protein
VDYESNVTPAQHPPAAIASDGIYTIDLVRPMDHPILLDRDRAYALSLSRNQETRLPF